MEKRRLRNKKSRVNCKDWYIKDLMNQKLTVKIEPRKELIETKKIHLKLTRKLKQLFTRRDKL